MMAQGATQKEAISDIAETLGVSEKTIHREISELKAFFQEKDVL
jgi:transcriptional antiterminator